jgi:3-methyladenine DNA glycosylase AlkD
MVTAKDVSQALRGLVNPEKAAFLPRFFKTGPGEYAEGDKFLGVVVPDQRRIAREFKDLPLDECRKLLESQWHEERLTVLFILVGQFKRGGTKSKAEIYELYLSNTKYINNWDLVDSSAPYISGPYLEYKPEKMDVLEMLAKSKSLWERRIAMLSTFHYIRQGRADEVLVIAEILVNDPHDLIQKAVGWMLREIGEKVGDDVEKQFLDKHYRTMPRTALRYAIEKFPPRERQHYLAK